MEGVTTTSIISPINVYGRSMYAAEQLIEKYTHCAARPTFDTHESTDNSDSDDNNNNNDMPIGDFDEDENISIDADTQDDTEIVAMPGSVDSIILRISNVYGSVEGDSVSRVVPQVVQNALNSLPIIILGIYKKKTQQRDVFSHDY